MCRDFCRYIISGIYPWKGYLVVSAGRLFSIDNILKIRKSK